MMLLLFLVTCTTRASKNSVLHSVQIHKSEDHVSMPGIVHRARNWEQAEEEQKQVVKEKNGKSGLEGRHDKRTKEKQQ